MSSRIPWIIHRGNPSTDKPEIAYARQSTLKIKIKIGKNKCSF
jgi:hypothetical protein